MYNKDLGDKLEFVIGEYAKDKYGNFYYPKDENGDEYMYNSLINETYPLFRSGFPRYRRDKNGNQIYEFKKNYYIYGLDIKGNQCYAQDIEKNEFYPPDNTIAKKSDGTYFYAVDKNRKTVFPTDEDGNEYYISDESPDRYAKDYYGNEVYPVLKKCETILNGRYAVNNENVPYYPKDKYRNEYYIYINILSRYAITWDGKVIVPEKNKLPYILISLQPAIAPHNILGRLLRKSRYERDYVTDVVLTDVKLPKNGKHYTFRSKHDDLIVIVPSTTITKSTVWCDII